MTPEAFETQLRNLDQTATRVRIYPDRETWRFEFSGKPYYLHFYPQGSKLSASGAPREFAGLKTFQDFKLPAVRVAAMLSGFRFGDRKGNALILHGIEPARRLSEFVPDPRLHYKLVNQLVELLKQMAHHEVGHARLEPSSFLVHGDKLLLLDAVHIRSTGLTTEQLLEMAHRFHTLATRADRIRVWRAFGGDKPFPQDKRLEKRFAGDLKADAVEPIAIGEWKGRFKARHDAPQPYARASHLAISAQDWQREWPRLIERLRSEQLDTLKQDRSGDVLSAEITLQGVPIEAVVKRPRNKFWYRHVLGAFRSSRAARLWDKARWLQVRHLPVEYPLIVMERRKLGYVVESIAIFEKVPGRTLDRADLDQILPAQRESFFRACGRILRRIEDTGLTHTDAKSSNWIVFEPSDAGPVRPVLIDAYGIRPLNAFLQLFGIRRLLRAMKDHPQYTPTDSLHLCQGFAPNLMPEIES